MKTLTLIVISLLFVSCTAQKRITSNKDVYILVEIIERDANGMKVQVLDAWFHQVKFIMKSNNIEINSYDSDKRSFESLDSDSALYTFLALSTNERCFEIFSKIDYIEQSPIKIHVFDELLENKYVILNIVWAGPNIQYFNAFEVTKKNIRTLNKNFADCSRFDLEM